MRRLLVVSIGVVAASLLTAPAALAHDGGEGFYGQTNDKVTTIAGFCIIGFFVAFVVFASLLQGHLEKRKHARLDAAKARAKSPEWSRGW
jgi:hypothetical protein